VAFEIYGGSTIRALEALLEEGHEVCGVRASCDRLAGPGPDANAQAAGAALTALRTIDEVYPQRPDRG
jgi:orotate phosphoribosyltransferase